MLRPLLSFRFSLLSLLCLSLRAFPSLAQTQFANLVTDKSGIVTDSYKAADGDLATNAVIKPTAALSYNNLRVRFPAAAAASKPAGMYFKSNVAVGLALLGGATINTYASGSSQKLESYTLSDNLLSLSIQASGATQFTFTPTKPFTEMELVFFSVVALGQDIAMYEAYSTVSPLPVVLTTFQGKATAAGVGLSWQTASEANAAYFVVERTDNPAAGSFQALGRVAAAGTTSQAQRYQFADAAPLARGYYRLRQVDHDGTATYSPVIAIAALLATPLAAYPSLASTTLTVTGAVGARLAITDHMGRTLQRVVSTASPQQLPVHQLPAGSYFVRNEATGESIRFVKVAGL